jgi:hypothetical protein
LKNRGDDLAKVVDLLAGGAKRLLQTFSFFLIPPNTIFNYTIFTGPMQEIFYSITNLPKM